MHPLIKHIRGLRPRLTGCRSSVDGRASSAGPDSSPEHPQPRSSPSQVNCEQRHASLCERTQGVEEPMCSAAHAVPMLLIARPNAEIGNVSCSPPSLFVISNQSIAALSWAPVLLLTQENCRRLYPLRSFGRGYFEAVVLNSSGRAATAEVFSRPLSSSAALGMPPPKHSFFVRCALPVACPTLFCGHRLCGHHAIHSV